LLPTAPAVVAVVAVVVSQEWVLVVLEEQAALRGLLLLQQLVLVRLQAAAQVEDQTIIAEAVAVEKVVRVQFLLVTLYLYQHQLQLQ
jgi:hypothetical protein